MYRWEFFEANDGTLPPCLNTLIKDQKREKKARGDGSGNDGKKEWDGKGIRKGKKE
jgi:hypothetical protein